MLRASGALSTIIVEKMLLQKKKSGEFCGGFLGGFFGAFFFGKNRNRETDFETVSLPVAEILHVPRQAPTKLVWR